MAFGLQINTSDGTMNTIDIQTAVFFGRFTVVFPEGTPADTLRYQTYPSGWASEAQSAGSMYVLRSKTFYTGSGSDPLLGYEAAAETTEEDANSRWKLRLTADLDATHRLEIYINVYARSSS